jgi:hypothetical protein
VAPPRTEVVAVDVHCLVPLRVMVSVGFLVTSIVQMVESYERVAQRVETVFQGLTGGGTGGAEQLGRYLNWVHLSVVHVRVY